MVHWRLLLVVLLLAPALSVGAADVADYEAMQRWRFAKSAIPVSAPGVTLERDVAAWSFSSGAIRPMEPLADGTVTGLTFEGKGTFRVDVPDAVERAHLARSSGRPDAARFTETFTRLVLRTSDPALVPALLGAAAAPGAVHETSRLAEKRHEHWLEDLRLDADARIVAALGIPGDLYTRIDMETEKLGWLTWEYDGQRQEEIQLSRWHLSFREVWLSLDRAADRAAAGTPGPARFDVYDIGHVAIDADLTKRGYRSHLGRNEIGSTLGAFRAELLLTPGVEGVRALTFDLHPLAEVRAVSGADRTPLPWIRAPLGERFRSIDDHVFDDSLVAILPAPLAPGRETRIAIEYDLDILDFVSGRSWYPGPPERWDDAHTAGLELTVPEKLEVRAMGERDGEPGVERGRRTQRWRLASPVEMMTFAFAERFEEESVEVPGGPTVTAFGSPIGFTPRARVLDVARDVAAMVEYFETLFASPYPRQRLYVTSIVGRHGQSFDGFLHLSESTFNSEHPGASQLFRAHETAHQWWGHRMGFETYRDQWLSEAFAEYSGMMFVEAHVAGGRGFYDEMVRVGVAQINGSYRGMMSKFARPWMVETSSSYRERLGPISLGYRAATAEMPYGYIMQSYSKGALVLHMVRRRLRVLSGSDDLFERLLRELLRAHDGASARTADVVAALERVAPGDDWPRFIAQWVDGTAIPTYAWRAELPRAADAAGKWPALVTVTQSGVPPGFAAHVPVAVELEDGSEIELSVLVVAPRETFTLSLPRRPRKIVFNPGDAVIAVTKKL